MPTHHDFTLASPTGKRRTPESARPAATALACVCLSLCTNKGPGSGPGPWAAMLLFAYVLCIYGGAYVFVTKVGSGNCK